MKYEKDFIHVPVLKKEVLKYLDPRVNENFIDCTIGEAGHALAILEKNGPDGKVLGIDQDPKQIENCRSKRKISSSPSSANWRTRKLKVENFRERLILVCDSFTNLKEIVKREKFEEVSGILFDLGMSSWHLEKSDRGFSFQKDEPLDMRYNIKSKILMAEKVVNEYSEKEIEKILKEYGQERFAKRIAKKIIEERKRKPIKSTFQLVEIIKKATPGWYHYRKIHPATRTFQALRITVNDELNNLKKALPQSLDILKPGGRLVIISFHSLEDRIVKNFFRDKSKEEVLEIVTKKPTISSKEEIKINPRSRSAKLRAVIKSICSTL